MTKAADIALLCALNVGEAQWALSSGADVNCSDAQGNTPLHIAALNNDREMLALCLDKGADANMKDRDGNTPLHNAAEMNYIELVHILVERGADCTTKNNDGKAAFDVALDKGFSDCVELFIQDVMNKQAVLKAEQDRRALEIKTQRIAGTLKNLEHLDKITRRRPRSN